MARRLLLFLAALQAVGADLDAARAAAERARNRAGGGASSTAARAAAARARLEALRKPAAAAPATPEAAVSYTHLTLPTKA